MPSTTDVSGMKARHLLQGSSTSVHGARQKDWLTEGMVTAARDQGDCGETFVGVHVQEIERINCKDRSSQCVLQSGP